MRALIAICLCLFSQVALAAMIPISWVNPTQHTDTTPLTDLTYIRIEWGSCVHGAFGTLQASLTVKQTPVPTTSASVFPTGLNPVCIQLYAGDSLGIESVPSNVLVVAVPGVVGAPVTLGQPIQLPPK